MQGSFARRRERMHIACPWRVAISRAVAVVCLSFLVSCTQGTGGPLQPAPAPSPPSPLQPLPQPAPVRSPLPPQETYPGEAEAARNAINKIRGGRYKDVPPVQAKAASPSEGDTRLTVSNLSLCTFGVYLDGPVSRAFGLHSQNSLTVPLRAGTYVFAVNARCPQHEQDITPLLGVEVYDPGFEYLHSLSIEYKAVLNMEGSAQMASPKRP